MSDYVAKVARQSLGNDRFILAARPVMALLVLPAWWAIGGIRRAYQAKWLSDQTLVFDAIWLFQAVLLSQELIHEVGMLAWVGLSAFLAYKLVTFVGLRSLDATAGRRPIARMLLLRVFGFQRRAERLFDLLGGRWRYAGPIQMIAAPDLASSTIGPDKFMLSAAHDESPVTRAI